MTLRAESSPEYTGPLPQGNVLHVSGTARVLVGLTEQRVSVEHMERMRDRLQERFPGVEFTLMPGVAALVAFGDEPGDDLTVAATRMHDALYYLAGDKMDEHLGPDVMSAYGQLQQALKRRGWTV